VENSYLVFTRKWRPQTFDEIIGQDQVVTPLKRAIELNRVMHAYIFSGPRGVGKTTAARVLAKALNCEKGPTTKPCNECDVCREIMEGSSLDVIEIDGASNRGINEIRELREHIGFAPAKGRYKVYIIDEVHMLTKEAFNALLKTLEEPPKHVIFIFATTDPQQIPQTILSRCQHFRFRRMPANIIVTNLKMIAKNEKISYEEEALYMIAKAADGALRDAQRIFDQSVTYVKGKKLTANIAAEMLGEIDFEVLNSLTDAIVKKDLKAAVETVEKVFEAGVDLKHFLKDFIELLRNVLIIKTVNSKEIIEQGEEEYNYLKEMSGKMAREEILYMLQKAIETEQLVDRSSIPNIVLETTVIDMVLRPDKNRAAAAPEPAPRKTEITEELKQEIKEIKAQSPPKEEEKPSHQSIIIDSIEEEEEIKKLTKDIIEKRWPNIIERAKENKENEKAMPALETSGVVSYEEPSVFITGENPFYTGMLKEYAELITQLLKEEFKKELKAVIYEKEEFNRKFQVKKDVMEEEAKNHPVVKELGKIFSFSDIAVKKIK